MPPTVRVGGVQTDRVGHVEYPYSFSGSSGCPLSVWEVLIVAIDSPRLVDVDECADHWGISRASVYNLLKEGLPSIRIGRLRRFDLAACSAWLAERQQPAA
jgi:excisionase family DNA binding protein